MSWYSSPTLSGYSREQTPDLDQLIELFLKEGVNSYLEVGCKYGDNLHTVGMALPRGSRVVGIELPDVDKGHILSAVRNLNENGRIAQAIFMNSHLIHARDWVMSMSPFDAVMIDGDHSKAGVARDFELYAPLGKMIVLDDIEGCAGVSIFWKKVSKRHEVEKIGSRYGVWRKQDLDGKPSYCYA